MSDIDTKSTEPPALSNQEAYGHSRELAKEIYRYSRDLAYANKTLNLLRDLYKITLLSLDPVAVATQVSTLMRDSLRRVALLNALQNYTQATDLQNNTSKLKTYLINIYKQLYADNIAPTKEMIRSNLHGNCV